MPPSFACAGGTEKILERQTGSIPAREALVDRAARVGRAGLVDRRLLIEVLDTAHSPHPRSVGNFAIAAVEIDHFKSTHDAHGHPLRKPS
jgi:GGDEF domain-containing protein